MRYRHELTDVLNLPGEIPSDINRYSARAGVTIWLPLYGAF